MAGVQCPRCEADPNMRALQFEENRRNRVFSVPGMFHKMFAKSASLGQLAVRPRHLSCRSLARPSLRAGFASSVVDGSTVFSPPDFFAAYRDRLGQPLTHGTRPGGRRRDRRALPDRRLRPAGVRTDPAHGRTASARQRLRTSRHARDGGGLARATSRAARGTDRLRLSRFPAAAARRDSLALARIAPDTRVTVTACDAAWRRCAATLTNCPGGRVLAAHRRGRA